MRHCDNCKVGGGECDGCAAAHEIQESGSFVAKDGGQKTPKHGLREVMKYEFDPLIHRLVDKRLLSEKEARQGFADLKRYMFLCVSTQQILSPPPRIDAIWHEFLMFTYDYIKFCRHCFGKYIHHRPQRRGEKPSENGGVRYTIRLAKKRFKKLSRNWRIPHRFPRKYSGCT